MRSNRKFHLQLAAAILCAAIAGAIAAVFIGNWLVAGEPIFSTTGNL
jgi:hypothetical protein